MRKFKSLNQNTGALLWVMSIQYYIAQLIVASAWSANNPYSWAHNTISDLGNTVCGLYGSKLVCSPLYVVMNISFFILGMTMIGGAIILRSHEQSTAVKIGYNAMIAAGIGTILVAIFPENTVSSMHILGAALPFFFGNVGMIVIGIYSKNLGNIMRYFSIVMGAIGLVSLGLFLSQIYVGLGIGGMERVVSYPQSIWMTIFGLYLLIRSRNSKQDLTA